MREKHPGKSGPETQGVHSDPMKNVLIDTYKGKTVLITGHTGFKGSWLSTWLKELGANVVGYALDPYTDSDNFVRSGLSKKMTDIRGDVRDFKQLKQVFDKYCPEIVFHLAAQPLVRESYRNPKETYDINVGGTVNVFESCRQDASVKVIVNVTSDKCYENKEWVWGYRENDSLGGYDPYSSSKACSELITASYRDSFFNPDRFQEHGKSLSSVRAGNVIGGGDWTTDRVIPDCIRSLLRDRKILVRNPEAVRPWQFVLEPLSGYLLLAARMSVEPIKYAGAWNFGPYLPANIPVKELVDHIVTYWGSGGWYTAAEVNPLHEAALLNLDISKTYHILGWRPVYTVEKAVAETVRWYKANRDGKDMYELCKEQIKEFASNL